MANFRKNHNRERNPFVGLWVRVLVMIAILVVLFLLFYSLFESSSDLLSGSRAGSSENEIRDYIPKAQEELPIINHAYYSLGYSEKHELASWVAYVLTKEDLKIPNVKRHKEYITDPKIKTRSAHYADYKGSGYTRGHLAPAGDMAFSKAAMKESFYMSNMAPQLRGFNNGIWKELEENVRDWAYDDGQLYVTTGPLLNEISGYIGDNGVVVPTHFYKALFDASGREKKGIAFIIPHEVTSRPLSDYAVSIDELENKLNMDLFPSILDEDEEKIEQSFNLNLWPVDKRKYQQRIEKWNYE